MKKYVHTQFSGLVVVLVSVLSSVAHSEPAGRLAPSTQSDIENQQAQRLQDIEDAKQSLETLVPTQTLPQSVVDDEEQCFQVERIELEGNTVFTSDTLLDLLDFEPACIGLTRINDYLRIITNGYVEAGYVTSRAFLVPQDLSSGALKVVVLEGRLEALLFNGEPQTFLSQAFPGMEGGLLNLRDIEQGLDQINRLRRYNAQIQLLPGSKQGYSVVDIKTGTGTFGSFGVGFNNSGQASTGEELLSYTLSGENWLGLLDKWTLNGSKSAEFIDSRDAESLYFSLDVPVGYWNIGYATSYSTYKTSINSRGMTITSNGKTNSHDVSLRWLFHRDGLGKSALSAKVNHRREKNYLLGNLIETSSRNLSSASMTLELSRRMWGGFFALSPSLVVGTDWFGGEEDGETGKVPSAQFYKSTLTASVTYPLPAQLSYTSTVFSQWSNDTLYGSQRLSIGGEYSVRGFKDVSISGDEGYYWRNDLTYPLGEVPYLGHVRTQWAMDTGTIVPDSTDAFERGSLWGTSFSLSTANPTLSTGLTVGFPMAAPSRLKVDDYVLYYRLNLTY
ncbi:ShlB/FhaC/HecB family hemolysin secretion/activation protein [Vibrio sp. HN007]|uniref:ShlB/FhaC/HecB family hemolysin secretion/activation protein n=1 Tax=Vibrio iocasae TaxID=3098914 RepID=UPI0035D4D0A7